MKPRVVLVKPPERSAFNFGTFSLAVLAAAGRDLAVMTVLDATDAAPGAAAREIAALRPDLVGITVSSYQSIPAVDLFVRELRRAVPAATVVAGGHGASMTPEPLLNAGVDAVVMGEGETTFRAILAEGIRPGAPGLATRTDGAVVRGPPQPLIRPLDRLPRPARDLIAPPPDGVHLMETSRGCPHGCTFCEATRFFGRRWRAHSPGRVAAEVTHLVDDHDAYVVHFADDNFAASPARVLEICAALGSASRPAFIMASARIDDLLAHPQLIPALAGAGIRRVSVGVEALDPAIGDAIGKPLTVDQCRQAFTCMREHGIFSVASFIVGLPGESPEARSAAADLAVAAGPDAAQFLPLFPLPGTPLGRAGGGCVPEHDDVRDAAAATRAFYEHPLTRRRLEATTDRGGVAGLLARGTLDRRAAAGHVS